MCKTKKIIAGVLCAIVAGIGIISINAQTADAQTAASQGTIATAGMSLEQLQQIIEMLKQQIQQIILLLQQRTYVQPVCGNGICEAGETITNCPQDCKKDAGCPMPKPCALDPNAGVIQVEVWAKNPTTGECCQYGLACHAPTGWATYSSDSECKGSITACAKEGEKKYASELASGRPTECCSGLTAISSCTESGACPLDGSSICTYCGNGICGLGENKVNCPKDCPATGVRCTDSDGGINYYVKGTAIQYSSSGAVSNRETDTCYLYNPDLFDSATDSASAGYWLREAYCNGGTLAHKVFECQYDCENGACLRQATNCAKEGESTARGNIVPCCDGLTAVPNSWVDLTTGKCGYNDPAYDICTKCGDGICGVGENICNCPQDCKKDAGCPMPKPCALDLNAGVIQVAVWAKNPTTGECCQYGLACHAPTGWATYSSDSECKGSITACAKEGEKKYASELASGRPTECCSGLTAISSCTESGACPLDGSSICTYCGNGICGLGENKVNCPKDCPAITCVSEEHGLFTDPSLNCCAGFTRVIASVSTSGTTGLSVTSYRCLKGFVCVGEGETFTDANRQCCAGLVRQSLEVNCASSVMNCAGYPLQYTCVKPVAQKTCAQVCREQGYSNGQCSTYAVSPQGFANKCGSFPGYIVSSQSGSDCQIRKNADGLPVVGVGAVCCCGNIATKCLQEGQIGSGGPLSITMGRQECCPGLKAWAMPNTEDAPFLCTAKCGNGICDSSLEKTYCPQDCAGVCGRSWYGGNTNPLESQCISAGGRIYCDSGLCKCTCDTPKPACSSSLPADQCKIAGGAYVCPENYSTTSVYLGAGSATTYYKSNCFCSCPAPLSVSPTTTSSSLSGGTQTSTVNLSGGTASTVYIGGGVGN